jgi:MOSC domain-containing protein YiiM
VLLLDTSIFAELARQDIHIGPCMMGENITVDQIAVMELAVGTRLQIGHALVEVTEIRNPCQQLNGINPRLLKAVATKEQGRARFKAGIMACILQGGWVHPGDQISIDATAHTFPGHA